MDQALSDVTVIDLGQVIAMPFCTMLLADMGARVIKVESRERGRERVSLGVKRVRDGVEERVPAAQYRDRNKLGITLELKTPKGAELFKELVARADVVTENWSVGTMERLGLGYESVAGRWPRLVYCSISGFGQTGPRAAEPGYDAVIQGEAGLMSITGAAEGPPFRLGVAIADIVSGMYAMQGIAMALLARVRTGRGQRVDVGMLDATAALLTYQAGIYFATGATPGRMGNRHPTIVPYETFQGSDGEFVVAVGNDEQWRRFCRIIDLAPLADDERFATNRARVGHYDELRPLLADRLHSRRRDEWVRDLKAAGVPCGSVRDVAEALEDPQLDARRMIETVDHVSAGAVRVLGVPVKLSDTPGAVRSAPPTLGQHTDRILKDDAGLTEGEIETLRSSKVI